jgi:enoyl-[acyl-carrier protein] reductase III
MRFENQVALVTGSGRGIGRAIALRLAEEGAEIVVNFFRNRKPAEGTVAAIQAVGRTPLLVKANIGNLESLASLFHQVEARFGRLDILICNAASGYNRPVLEQRPKGWDWTMNINARSLLFAAQHAARLMGERGGHIVSVSSPGSTRVIPDYVAVGASKAALEAVTRYLAVELAPRGIVVNAVSPGIVATEALRHFDLSRDASILAKAIRVTPAGRIVTAEDVAAVVAFLCSDEAAMIRGQTIVVDGGLTLPVPGAWPAPEV